EAPALSFGAERRDRAAPADAEAEVVADDDVPRREALHEQRLDEIFRREPADRLEPRTEELVDAAVPQLLEALAKAREPRRRIVRREILGRHRLERARGRNAAVAAADVDRGAQDRRVAQVQPTPAH